MPRSVRLKNPDEFDLLLEYEQVLKSLRSLYEMETPTWRQLELYILIPELLTQAKKLKDFEQFPLEELVNTLKIASNAITMPTEEHADACAEQGKIIAPYVDAYTRSLTVSFSRFFHKKSGEGESALDQIMQMLSRAVASYVQVVSPK